METGAPPAQGPKGELTRHSKGPMADFTSSMTDENVATRTSEDQSHTEDVCLQAFEDWLNADGSLARDLCVHMPKYAITQKPLAAL